MDKIGDGNIKGLLNFDKKIKKVVKEAAAEGLETGILDRLKQLNEGEKINISDSLPLGQAMTDSIQTIQSLTDRGHLVPSTDNKDELQLTSAGKMMLDEN